LRLAPAQANRAGARIEGSVFRLPDSDNVYSESRRLVVAHNFAEKRRTTPGSSSQYRSMASRIPRPADVIDLSAGAGESAMAIPARPLDLHVVELARLIQRITQRSISLVMPVLASIFIRDGSAELIISVEGITYSNVASRRYSPGARLPKRK
jgi:hypothetical protein